MFYDKLKKKFKNEIIFLNTTQRNELKFDEKKEKILFCEGCWEALSKEEIENINSYRMCFMNMHPNTQYRIPLQPYIDFKPNIDFNNRDIDVFYCGEAMKSFNWINNDNAVVCERSSWSRLNMIANSLMIKNKKVVMLPQPHWGGNIPKEEYSDMMSRTKIALCPIGSTWESHRISEAAFYGCVIITTPFDASLFPFGGNVIPDYLKNAPFIFIDKNWKDLPKVINELTNEKMFDIHQKTLNWANEYLSEDAIIQRVSDLYSK